MTSLFTPTRAPTLTRAPLGMAALAAIAFSLVGCDPEGANRDNSGANAQCGGASYYNDALEGKPTASGEPYRAAKKTGAHRTHPFGTKVKVTRQDNGASVTVTINDRGPFVESRVIDLSRAAAEKIDLVTDGVTDVCLKVL